MPRAFEPYHELCMRCGCILSCFNFGILPNLTLGAMFPGRWPNYPESMWNYGWSTPSFSSPQPAVPPGQFCGSDMMSQQSQAQSQAQTQAQLAHLREQNSILNQQLASQAQTHIQHLQQLLPFHQSTSHPPQSTPTAPEPPTPVATQSTPPGPSAPFSAEEMMQQMKNTVESSMQAFVDMNQERNMSHPPTPAQPPIQASPPIPSHPLPSDEVLPPPQHSYRPWGTGQTSTLCSTKSTSRPIAQTNTSFLSATFVTQETTFHFEELLKTSKQGYIGHLALSLSTSTRSTTRQR